MSKAEMDTLIELLNARERPENPTPEMIRERFNKLATFFPLPGDATVEPVDAGGVPAEWVSAPGAGETVIQYVHGGGYVIGSAADYRTLAYGLSKASGARVLNVDYRLAPEHPFPAAIDDSVAAYGWLTGAGGAKPGQTAIAGDSAGGGLTLASLLAIRDGGGVLPAAGISISPWADLEMTGESMQTKAAVDPLIQHEQLIWFSDHYLNGADPKNPLASPIHAELGGLPPLLILVGSAETLLDDSHRIADRAKTAGVDTTLEVWDNMIHIWPYFAPMLSEGRDAIERIGGFVKDRLG
jgi:acetyl esterase/lipase